MDSVDVSHFNKERHSKFEREKNCDNKCEEISEANYAYDCVQYSINSDVVCMLPDIIFKMKQEDE